MAVWEILAPKYKNIHHKKWKNAAIITIGPEWKDEVDQAEFNEKKFDYGTKLAVSAITNILTENIAEAKCPADWWQHFKKRWFPFWALKKFPVKYKTIDIFRLYPMATLQDKNAIFKYKTREE